MDFDQVRRALSDAGAQQIYAKVLAANDNSKNQPYFGGDFRVLNILPAGSPYPTASGKDRRQIFRASLDFYWLDDSARLHQAPNAKLILYPQYPEVRFSGYLQGCAGGPSGLMGSSRLPGRVLLLGVTGDGRVIGHASAPGSAIAQGLAELRDPEQAGVFVRVPIPGRSAAADRTALLDALRDIADCGWIESHRLDSAGLRLPCNAPNCGGYTLEAKLGITPNGISEPDFRGWEVKQHRVSDFANYAAAGAITLMTPEPSAGLYATGGVGEFVERYGYPDTRGRAERRNFGGTHRFGAVCERTGLTLTLAGYDRRTRRITDTSGGIVLVGRDGENAAMWPYATVLEHWRRKHALAVYVPSMVRNDPELSYRYGYRVRLGSGTDALRLLDAIAAGAVYYDPGIKVEGIGAGRRIKRRSQFRIRSADIGSMYDEFEHASLREANRGEV